MVFNYNKHLKEYSQHNRKYQTEAEWKFWNLVLKKDMTWYRFLRQKPIWNYILDFYCDKLKLWIEIDDRSHDWKWEDDEKRTEYLNNLWVKIIRYTNEDINCRLNEVILDLEEKLNERNKEIQNL
jgi:very-short-patch-repair endonuclease